MTINCFGDYLTVNFNHRFTERNGKNMSINKFKSFNKFKMINKYSRLSLSRLRYSRITAYLEEKFWPLFKHRNLTSGNKILWIRGKIAPQEQFLPFPRIFSIYISNYRSLITIHLRILVVRFVFSSILKI